MRTGTWSGRLWRAGLGMGAWIAGGASGRGGSEEVAIPNGSFEQPASLFVSTRIDAWQETERPLDYPESGGFLWDQLTGIFQNTVEGAADHIFNLEGKQGAYLFAIPGVGIFQDGETRDWDDPAPSGAFSLTFESGFRYTLSAGVIGAGGGMLEGVPLELMIYARGAAGEREPVVSRWVTNSVVTFPNRQRTVDFSVATPVLAEGSPWLGKQVGVGFFSRASEAMRGGYWVVDRVRFLRERLEEGVGPLRIGRSKSPGLAEVAWQGRAGWGYRVWVSDELRAWREASEERVGQGGEMRFEISTEGGRARFVRVTGRELRVETGRGTGEWIEERGVRADSP